MKLRFLGDLGGGFGLNGLIGRGFGFPSRSNLINLKVRWHGDLPRSIDGLSRGDRSFSHEISDLEGSCLSLAIF